MVSDWGSVGELINHGVAADRAAAAARARCQVDMDMVGGVFAEDLRARCEGSRPLNELDEAVLRILRVKEQLGLFDNPCSTTMPSARRASCSRPEHREAARASRDSRSCC